MSYPVKPRHEIVKGNILTKDFSKYLVMTKTLTSPRCGKKGFNEKPTKAEKN